MADLVSPDDTSPTGSVVYAWAALPVGEDPGSVVFAWRALLTTDGLARFWLGPNGRIQYTGRVADGRLLAIKAT